MKSLIYATILLMLASGPSTAQQQLSGAAQKSPQVAGNVEPGGAQPILVLINLSDTQTFQGSISISFGSSANAPLQFKIALAPKETRRLTLHLPTLSDDQYTLMIRDQNGALILSKIAQIKPAAGTERGTPPKQTSAVSKSAGEVKVNARLSRGLASSEAELPTPDKVEPFLLTFEIESVAPIKDASFALSGKEFQRRQPVTVQSRARFDFPLPETLGERKLSYTLTNSAGQPLARGEVDLDQLTASDAISISALTFDQAAYAPGESARTVLELQSDAPRGYRLELLVKDGEGKLLFKNERRGATVAGTSRQEFLIELPREVKGPVTLMFQAFGGQTGQLSDSGVREIILNEAPLAKTGEGKRLSP